GVAMAHLSYEEVTTFGSILGQLPKLNHISGLLVSNAKCQWHTVAHSHRLLTSSWSVGLCRLYKEVHFSEVPFEFQLATESHKCARCVLRYLYREISQPCCIKS